MKWLLEKYCQMLNVLIGLLMAWMVIPVFLQIVSRFSASIPRFVWTEEAARFCFVWIVMIGSMLAVRDDAHFSVDLFPEPSSNWQKGLARLVVHAAMAILGLVFAWYGIEFAKFGIVQSSEMSGINMLWIYVAFPLAGFTWLVFLTEKIVADISLMRISSAASDREQRHGTR